MIKTVKLNRVHFLSNQDGPDWFRLAPNWFQEVQILIFNGRHLEDNPVGYLPITEWSIHALG